MRGVCKLGKKPHSYWTKERCAKEASLYKKRSHFSRGSSGAYNKAREKGWLVEICSHMPEPKHGNWDDKALCKIEADKYQNRSDFSNGSRSAYKSCLRNGWIDDLCVHMETRPYLGKRFVYEIVCHERQVVYVGLTFSIEKRKWQHENNSKHLVAKFGLPLNLVIISGPHEPYEAARIEKQKVTEYQENGYEVLNKNGGGSLGTSAARVKYTYDYCKTVALKYENLKDFRKQERGVYSKACQKSWIDDICSHMSRATKPMNYWQNKENCAKAASECKSLNEFTKTHYQAMTISKENGWFNEISAHFEPYKKPLKYEKSECLLIAKSFKTRTEFRSESPKIYDFVASHGFLDEACTHMTYVGTPKGYWTKERCVSEAAKYNTRKEFIRGSGGCYNSSKREGWLEEVCAHMICGRKLRQQTKLSDLFGPIP